MNRLSRLIKLAVLGAVGTSLSGCIVLPWGGHRHGGHGGYGGGHHLSAGAPPPAVVAVPRDAPRDPFQGRRQ